MARLTAVQAVMGVLRSTAPLQLPASAERLSGRDRALAMEIATGTLRHLATLDYLLKSCMNRPLPDKHQFIWAVLRTALYQALYLRIPERAAVYEAVELLKGRREESWSGFANGVLRAVLRVDRQALWQEIKNPQQRMAVQESYPEWLVARWWQRLGEEGTRRRLQAGNQIPPLTVRVNTLATTTERLLEALAERVLVRSASLEEAITLRPGEGAVEKIPGYGNGWFAVQDQAAQWVAPLLAPQPGECILDACAAPGGKTAHLAALAGNQLRLTAVEKDPARLPRLLENMQRLRVQEVEIVTGDAGDPALLAGRSFDRALLDVPCSGTGVIRRHPEIKWRRQPEDLQRLCVEQQRILQAVATRVKVGGTLVYATCSLEPEENEQQVEHFLSQHPQWRRQSVRPAGMPADERGDLRIEMGEADCDGFYAASLQRVGE
ncbi:16S rRNA (cytosine(967)-C(5))-methyltransferase RsmB [Candidatus Magnetaquicoccus inordinatus]|uniref:16S rRNA (cytosine(967)-C(5))-methyltransferase RsmB n=1 Tax=Candidatus Magnetaquicoccus inordinatus TaxID=2496818 RepID=UPI00102BDE33|nr:16S rRNA (cytosine(967)-C(5))-methyltransferase RsmB [Candidatus Magnetaquicoccus inordinatus]